MLQVMRHPYHMVFQLAILATTLFDRLIWCADDAINEGEGMGEAIVQRLATQEVIAQAVLGTTRSGRVAKNRLGFESFRDMQLAGRKEVVMSYASKRRTQGLTGHHDQCTKCWKRGELIMCDKPGCREAYHLRCVDLSELPPEDEEWFCPDCVRE
jgi:hypothetical protein